MDTPEDTIVSFRIDVATRDIFAALAKKEDQTASQLHRRLMRDYIAARTAVQRNTNLGEKK